MEVGFFLFHKKVCEILYLNYRVRFCNKQERFFTIGVGQLNNNPQIQIVILLSLKRVGGKILWIFQV
jgi:hypothetical protein